MYSTWEKMFYEMIDLLSPILILFVVVYAFMFFLTVYRRDRRKNEEQSIKRYTFEFCIKNDKSLDSNFTFSSKNRELFMTSKYMQESLSTENEVWSKLIYYNKIAAGVNCNVLDEQIIRSCYEASFIQYYYLVKKPLLDVRDELRNPTLFIDYEILVRKWREDNSKRGL